MPSELLPALFIAEVVRASELLFAQQNQRSRGRIERSPASLLSFETFRITVRAPESVFVYSEFAFELFQINRS